MKRLGLFRHAKSDIQARGTRDFDRPLNDRGRKGATLMGDFIRRQPQRWDKVIASPAVRTVETIEIAAGARAGRFPIAWDERIYLASAATLRELLREADDALDAVMLVGHNPGLEDLILDLVPDDGSSPLRDLVEQKFPTAAFAVLELPIARWRELAAGPARLLHLTCPRDLEPSLGPESAG